MRVQVILFMGSLLRAILKEGLVPFLDSMMWAAIKMFFIKYWWITLSVILLILVLSWLEWGG